jgi:tetraacyldisaccharide 4'-kinase
LREEDAELEATLRRYTARDCRFWQVRRTLALSSTGKRAVGFCAIARPEEFFRALAAAGVDVVERVSFRDHHRYTAGDMERLTKLARRHGCDEFVTTAKDEVKLDASLRFRLNAVAPLRTAALTVEIKNEGAAVSQIVSLLRV